MKRKFKYAWRTSDNIIHENVVLAHSRDEVYSIAKKNGIKPCSVAEIEHSQFVLKRAALAVGLIVGIGCVVGSTLFALRRERTKEDVIIETFRREAGNVLSLYSSEVATMRIGESFATDALTKSVPNGKARFELGKARDAINIARSRLRVAYKDISEKNKFTSRIESGVQQIYGAAVSAFDGEESKIETMTLIVDFLEENQGQWQIKDGKFSFTTPELAEEFRSLRD